MSDAELVAKIDAHSQNTVVGIGFLYDELRNRELSRLNRKMIGLIWVVTVATIIVTIATIANLYLVYATLS
ncbi:hypothetical protein [Aliiroseovarius crassostreae]|uniref:hypothetical protein n=1 Tax=Aliiroseovarius crassostreae TaxID=154981 RepID=UPI003C7A2606